MGNLFTSRTSETVVLHAETEPKEYIQFLVHDHYNYIPYQPVFETEWNQVDYVHMIKDESSPPILFRKSESAMKMYQLTWKNPDKKPILIKADKYQRYVKQVPKTQVSPSNQYVPVPEEPMALGEPGEGK